MIHQVYQHRAVVLLFDPGVDLVDTIDLVDLADLADLVAFGYDGVVEPADLVDLVVPPTFSQFHQRTFLGATHVYFSADVQLTRSASSN